MTELGKILIITDVHGKIKEMVDFINMMVNTKHEHIDFVVHLGDFWSGRNYDPKTGEQNRDEFVDLDYFKKLPVPIYHIKGNEDLTQPDQFWNKNNMWLMQDQEPFFVNGWKSLPIDYQYPGELSDTVPKHPEFSVSDEFDIMFSHRPPFGVLDDTLHFKTHKKLSNTGSPMIREYYDKIKPPVFLFGHFHYSNFQITDIGVVVCIDKLIRIGGINQDEFRYSYGLLDPFDQSLEIYWKNRQFLRYSILEKRILKANRFDKRNLYSHRKQH